MSLLRDIQAAAIDSNVNLADLLRKCKVLAVRLQNEEFKRWVDQELNGYTSKGQLPEYRIVGVESFGYFSGGFGRVLRNAPIPPSTIPEEFRDMATTAFLMEAVSSLAELVNKGKEGNVTSYWPADLVAFLGERIYRDMNCLQAWRLISRASIVGVLDTVRNRILNFVLEIESEAPNAGEAQPDAEPVPQERVAQVFQTHIFGNVGSLAAGSRDFTQTTMMQVQQGDLDSLKSYLEAMGVAVPDIEDLGRALSADACEATRNEIGDQTSTWLGKMLSKASSGALDLTVSAAGSILGTAISTYLGLSP